MGRLDNQIKAAQERAKKEFERAEEERKRELLKKRVTIANEGVRAFEGGKWVEANKHFITYIGVLENWKKVGHNGLHPGLFDKKADITELLLISGVYWDLVKIYDRAKGKEREFNGYLDKYVLFSQGMPYQTMCAEAIRKHLARGKAINKASFKRAYSRLAKTKCFVATSLVDLLPEETFEQLWWYRDEVLNKRVLGRVFVAVYYFFGPSVASVLNHLPHPVRRWVANQILILGRHVSLKTDPQ